MDLSCSNPNIRLAKYSDLPRIAEIFATAFREEQLHQILFPYRHEYYADYARVWRHKVYESWWDYGKVLVVSTKGGDEGELIEGRDEESQALLPRDGGKPVTGVATWARKGLGWEKMWPAPGRWDPRRLILPLVKFWHKLHFWIWGNRAMNRPTPEDPTPITYFNFQKHVGPFIGHYFTTPEYRKNHWELAVLGVDPKYQGRGVGGELAKWGLEKAKKEELPAVVIGAIGLEDFYERCGFEFLVGYASEGVDEKGNVNPFKLRGIGGGCIRWTRVKEDPEVVEVVEKAVLVTDRVKQRDVVVETQEVPT